MGTRLTLVLGGTKSGKSDFALRLFQDMPGTGVVLATGRARDMAFRRQILKHREERAPGIPVVETGPDLPQAIRRVTVPHAKTLVDSLDFWLFESRKVNESGVLLDTLAEIAESSPLENLIMVSSETGLGPLPGDARSIAFMRELGALNQAVAGVAHEVYLVAAGLPLKLK